MIPRINLVQPIFYDSHLSLPHPPYSKEENRNGDNILLVAPVSGSNFDRGGRVVNVGKTLKLGAFVCVTALLASWVFPPYLFTPPTWDTEDYRNPEPLVIVK